MAKKDGPAKRSTASSSGSPKPKTGKVSAAALQADIRRTDAEIIKLVSRRVAATLRLIQADENPTRAAFLAGIEPALAESITKHAGHPAPEAVLRGVFREIIGGARQLHKSLKVAYLGPASSFSHLAALERFGSSATLMPVSNIAAVFEEVKRGHAQYGIVPIENSTDGRIVDTLDMFTRIPLKICGEVQLSIHHYLMAKCSRDQIGEIYSKQQALSQCRGWLSRNMPHARIIEVGSTALAAELARDKEGAAAIASRQAAIQYDLTIVAEKVEDNKENVTRFAVIGDEATKPTGKDKTAVLVQIPHKPGTLADTLQIFKKGGVNLTWIESFPLRGPEKGYLFFLDFEGHAADLKVKKTIAELEAKADRIEVLGSYAKAEPVG